MTKVEFDVPGKVIEKAAKEKIEDLERKLTNAEKREANLKRKIASMESDMKVATIVLSNIFQLIDEIKYEPQFEDLIARYQ